jgi:hypothetical protein
MATTSILSGSVGFGGANRQTDVRLVQKLLNAVPTPKGGPTPLLDVDGLCGPLTCGAIKRFQFTNSTGYSDGRIDPGYKTEETLLALLKALGVLGGLIGHPGGGSPTAAPPPPPVVTNANTPIRRRFMDICRAKLPPHGTLTASKNPTNSKGTGCGGFPGSVFEDVPVLHPSKKGAFRVTVPGAGVCYLTSPMTIWEQFAKEVDRQYAPARTWVPFGGGARPLPGDIYVLGKYDNPSQFQHVGVIVSADGGEWMTADGGQGDGWQRGFVKRKFEPSGQIQGEFGNKAVVRGWVNLDAMYAVAISAFPAVL